MTNDEYHRALTAQLLQLFFQWVAGADFEDSAPDDRLNEFALWLLQRD